MSLGFEQLLDCRLLSHLLESKMLKPQSHRFYILRIEKNWQYWLNYSDDLLVKLHEKFGTFS